MIMASAKDIIVKPIKSAAANDLVKRVHYSGKVVPNSQLHFGVFLNDQLLGAMQFGPSMDKRKAQAFVRNTPWNGFLELNRMAFHELLPRNSESRAISIAMKLIRKHYPHIQWVVSYADGSQCGDGTIYRASGFLLTSIKPNTSMLRFPDGKVYATLPITNGGSSKEGCALRRALCKQWNVPYYSAASVAPFKAIGAVFVPGFQLRYIYLIDPTAKQRLAIPVLPFSKIEEAGAAMYKGARIITRGKQATNASSVSAAVQHRPPRSNSKPEAS
jgi:hypothetical protein